MKISNYLRKEVIKRYPWANIGRWAIVATRCRKPLKAHYMASRGQHRGCPVCFLVCSSRLYYPWDIKIVKYINRSRFSEIRRCIKCSKALNLPVAELGIGIDGENLIEMAVWRYFLYG